MNKTLYDIHQGRKELNMIDDNRLNFIINSTDYHLFIPELLEGIQ